MHPLLCWLAMEDELKPGGAAVSFLDKMSPDVAGPRLTWLTLSVRRAVTLLLRVRGVIVERMCFVYSAVVSGHDRD